MTNEKMSFATIQSVTAETELSVYSRMPLAPATGRGCRITDELGKEYLDLYGGHAVALTGHCHPHVVAAIQAQAQELIFYSSAVYSRIRAEANQAFLANAPFPGARLFHCCSGTEANEVAFKMARLATGREKIVSFNGSFHGRTIGSLSACGIEKYRKTSGVGLISSHVQIPFGELDALSAIDDQTAAIIVEPIQSLGGAVMASDDYYREIEKRCRAHGVKLIFDEIQTGLGRTGSFFFSQQVGVTPDLTTMAKGLASGIPTAAVLALPEIAALSKGGDQGTTFGGGPVAMAALKATMEVIRSEQLVENSKARGEQLRVGLNAIPGVVAVRGRGLLVGIEFKGPAKEIQGKLLEKGIITGGSSEPTVLRLLPPLTLQEADVKEFLEVLNSILEDVSS
ncbi:MAG: aspartate aminotransferase family protein [Planctomycetota bacterium]|nr:aspartate aminotransferase family protein [Planctomycetota bacterium]